ncbi:tripartite tricarboxylate transporter substrate-binding protein [Anatilimnocola aggregata]|nr:tripartite tricarboxylate transporter substrate-binding protein [Anatilimnocola aggregata]
MRTLSLVITIALFYLAIWFTPVTAAEYPNRTIVVICPWAAGGGTDRVARFLADQLQRELGLPVVVQNQTGGSGASGHAAGARARPDGYTITMGTFELSTMRAMGISDLTYRDFQPLMQVNADPAAILVRSDASWQSLADLLSELRTRSGKVKMSGTSAGGAWDLARAGLFLHAKLPIDSVVWVPSQGSAPSLVELLGGHVDAVCCSIPEAQSQLDSGQIRVLHVMTRQSPMDGASWEAVGWRGLFLPLGTPDDVRAKLLSTIYRIVRSPAYAEFMATNGFGIAIRSGDDFTAFLEEQEQRWQPVVTAAGYAPVGGRPRVVTTSDPGPWFFPAALAGCLVVGCGIVIGRHVWPQNRSQPSGDVAAPLRSWRGFWCEPGQVSIVLMLGWLVIYLVAMPWLGFFVSTQIFASTLMVRLGQPWWRAVLLAAAMLLAVYALFVWQFRVVLPTSPWWNL